MNCLNPTIAYLCGHKYAKDGVLSPRLVFSETEALAYLAGLGLPPSRLEGISIAMPCGHCLSCQMRKRKDMTVRLANECSMHEFSCFITLTYDDENIPTTDWRPIDDDEKQIEFGLGSLPERTLLPRDVQLFMKRLRRWLEYEPKRPRKDGIHRDHCTSIRYFAVGEYGGKTRRPHYHILIFGWTPTDKSLHSRTKAGSLIYRSAQIEKLWTYGFSSVADVDAGVARYCARYVTKKFARLNDAPDLTDCSVLPEFTLQSVRHGGMGAPWFDRFGAAACQVGRVNVRCKDRVCAYSVPQYYWSRLRKRNIPLWCEIRDQKLEWIKDHKCDVGDVVEMAEGICRERLSRVRFIRNQLECEKEYETL